MGLPGFNKPVLMAIYNRLYKCYGPQGWWPADSPFEVIVGAVLTQNTSWKNVEKAISRLKDAGQLSLAGISRLDHARLGEIIRPSGYFNIKATRLKNICAWITASGGLESLAEWPTDRFRRELLTVNGIGPETADDILLYGFDRPVFVIDAYTRRLFRKLGLVDGTESYEILRVSFETRLDPDPALYNEYHALIVRHAKERCDGGRGCLHCLVERPV